MRISVCLILLSLLSPALGKSQVLTIHHIDVGQGDATFVQAANGKNLLIDGGDRRKGNAAVLPYLKSLGVSSIDYLVVSHYHSDHLAGLNEVIKQLTPDSVRVIYDRGFMKPLPKSKVFAVYQSLVDKVPLHAAAIPGQEIHLSNTVTLQCVASDGLTINSNKQDSVSGAARFINLSDENDRSLVWILTSIHRFGKGAFKFRYFTGGDWCDTSNTTLLCTIGDVDVMKVSHHGSTTAISRSQLDILKPEAAIISVGDHNRYGHPRQQCLDCLQNTRSVRHIYQTEQGEVGWAPKVKAIGSVVISVHDSFYVVAADTFRMKPDTLYGSVEGTEETSFTGLSKGSVQSVHCDERLLPQIDVVDSGPATIKVFNILGHLVWSGPEQELPQRSFHLDLSSLHLPPGIYLLSAKTGSQHRVKKVIVLR